MSPILWAALLLAAGAALDAAPALGAHLPPVGGHGSLFWHVALALLGVAFGVRAAWGLRR